MGAVGVGLSPLMIADPFRERTREKPLASATLTRPLMGTIVTATVLHPSGDRAREALEVAFAEMERLIPILDRHDPESPVSQLNRQGVLRDVPSELQEVMVHAGRIHRLTRGAFDISIQPVLDLFEDSFSRKQTFPSEEEARRAFRLVGAESIRSSGKEIRFLREGMGVSLDGIAKGYIVEKAVSRLKTLGVGHALINAGGDILALGGRGDGEPWRIAIQDPLDRKGICQIIPLRDGAVATSGDYERFFDPEKRYHHIIDPETGYSPQRFTSVSVMAPRLTDADALATAAFVPSPSRTLEFLRAFSETEALWIDRKGRQERTENWPRARA